MTRAGRKIFFLVSAALLATVFWLGYSALPPAGAVPGHYGDMVNAIVVSERHMTDAVTAVNFDIRGFDTLGEEFILFTSVMGVALLMRWRKEPTRGDHEDKAGNRRVPPPSDAVRITAVLLVPATVLFGIYMVTHGQLTPGGGFQGGVILATAPLLLYLAGTFGQFRRVAPLRMAAIGEAIGAAAYILIGGGCVAMGGTFLQNLLPLGKTGSLTSGGIVPLIDLGVGLEVSGGLVLALLVYLEELVEEKEE
jgi:multicomponent Na+:H+ antiporter subunit B